MKEIAVTHASVKALLISFAAAAILLFALVGTAGAASPVGKDGTIHACYRVKGKPKGSLRIVPPSQKKCKRGERKVVWSAAGQAGTNGQSGTAGNSGQSGQTGANGNSSPNEAALKTEVGSLEVKIAGLEETLKGVTHGDLAGSLSALNGLDNTELLGAVDAVKGLTNGDLSGAVKTVEGLTNSDLSNAVKTVEGLTNTELTEAVNSLPVIDTLCTQGEETAKQVNLISGAVKGLGLSAPLKAIGLLEIPALPANLTVAGCSAP